MRNTPSSGRKASAVVQEYTEKPWFDTTLMESRNDSIFSWKKDIGPLKNFLIIWIDSNVNENNQIQRAINRLENIVEHVLSMTNHHECKRWLMNYNDDKQIILIVSSELEEEFLLFAEFLSSVIAIYRYSLDYKIDNRWIRHYSKVFNMFFDVDKLLKIISRDLINFQRDIGLCKQPNMKFPKDEILTKNVETHSVSLFTFQIVLIGISKHLNKLAAIMLKTLVWLTNCCVLEFDDTSIIDLNTLSSMDTFVLVNSEFVSTMENKPDNIKVIFILENDKNKVDQRERFATGEDLICQLADELYRYYKKEAEVYLTIGDSFTAMTKENQANRIHSELQAVHKKYYANDSINETCVIMRKTIILWFKSKCQDTTEVERMRNLFNKIISSFLVIDNQYECHKYVRENEFQSTIFLIINSDFEESVVTEFQQLPNIKVIYRYGQFSLKDKTNFTNYTDLCSQLAFDLIIYYNKLGDDYSAKKDAKSAKDMFIKAHELCNILAEL